METNCRGGKSSNLGVLNLQRTKSFQRKEESYSALFCARALEPCCAQLRIRACARKLFSYFRYRTYAKRSLAHARQRNALPLCAKKIVAGDSSAPRLQSMTPKCPTFFLFCFIIARKQYLLGKCSYSVPLFQGFCSKKSKSLISCICRVLVSIP